ncbi:MAG: glycosyltransferase N-terminal domain-containing protein [Candidatus Brocadiia bacterium]
MSWVLDAIYLLAALALLPYWLWKLPQAERYRAGILQRLGGAPPGDPDRPRLWVHCASVGEASIPRRLVARFRRRHPKWDIVFSTNTNTGAQRLRELCDDCTVFYMPLDLSFCVRRAMRRVAPSALVLVELEVWPNLLEVCRQSGIPVAIVSGRINAGSARRLHTLHRLWPPLWDALRLCCARSEREAERFRRAGIAPERVITCGSLKYDNLKTEPDADKLAAIEEAFGLDEEAPVLVAGSTHRGEETILAAAYRDLKIRHRRLRLIIAPRHVERARQVQAALEARGFEVARRTELDGARRPGSEAVLLLDTIGELVACYALATCVFVGRSLLAPGGGQNVIEPAALGKPILTGPHTGNFRPEMQLLLEGDAAIVVRDRADIVREVDRLLSRPGQAARLGSAARSVVLQSRGATERTLRRLEAVLECQGPLSEWSDLNC